MKANDLRVGNWVNYPIPVMIVGILPSEVISIIGVHIDIEDIEPIPLTPEILEDAGFEDCKNGSQLRVFEGYVFINSLFTGIPLTLEIDGNRMPLKKIQYVHQLQNLFYSLTGQELEIKL